MILAHFIEQLSDTGHPRFESSDPPDDLLECSEQTETVLRELHRIEQLAVPHRAPSFSLRQAHQGAGILCRLCQFLVFREIPAETLTDEMKRLSSVIPADESDSSIWSFDLVLRHLPSLYRFATNASTDDPLVDGILEIACRLPLSSVGIPLKTQASPNSISLIHQNPALSAVYADRIIDTISVDRLSDPVTCRKVSDAIGHFSNLSPKVASALAQSEFAT